MLSKSCALSHGQTLWIARQLDAVYGDTELWSPVQVTCFPVLSAWLAASLLAAVMTTSTSSVTYEHVH